MSHPIYKKPMIAKKVHTSYSISMNTLKYTCQIFLLYASALSFSALAQEAITDPLLMKIPPPPSLQVEPSDNTTPSKMAPQKKSGPSANPVPIVNRKPPTQAPAANTSDVLAELKSNEQNKKKTETSSAPVRQSSMMWGPQAIPASNTFYLSR